MLTLNFISLDILVVSSILQWQVMLHKNDLKHMCFHILGILSSESIRRNRLLDWKIHRNWLLLDIAKFSIEIGQFCTSTTSVRADFPIVFSEYHQFKYFFFASMIHRNAISIQLSLSFVIINKVDLFYLFKNILIYFSVNFPLRPYAFVSRHFMSFLLNV